MALHFNQPDHDGVNDMTVAGLCYSKGRLLEQQIIAKLGCVVNLGGGMNTDFRFMHLTTLTLV